MNLLNNSKSLCLLIAQLVLLPTYSCGFNTYDFEWRAPSDTVDTIDTDPGQAAYISLQVPSILSCSVECALDDRCQGFILSSGLMRILLTMKKLNLF